MEEINATFKECACDISYRNFVKNGDKHANTTAALQGIKRSGEVKICSELRLYFPYELPPQSAVSMH